MGVVRPPAAIRCGGQLALIPLVLAWRPLERKAPLEMALGESVPAAAPPLDLAPSGSFPAAAPPLEVAEGSEAQEVRGRVSVGYASAIESAKV